MSQAEQTLISLLLPEGILDYFELTQVEKEGKMLNIYLEEKNIASDCYLSKDLESKGFFPEVSIQDFPIRGQKVALCIKRRRWTVKDTNGIISRDWDLVRKGARMTTEFGLFLKGIFG
ncbi:transposase [Pedobacter sp. N36a]|uniref:ISAon1 family transposase N-terminal region protein n=1 Tax=Pedobacter sp. N36a TaxID=2767996 RepID=UPI0016574D69|nr:transposase [Pedobacter sp. N36a]MBC8988443.1 transposase [Pedobacter sp. N36a]